MFATVYLAVNKCNDKGVCVYNITGMVVSNIRQKGTINYPDVTVLSAMSVTQQVATVVCDTTVTHSMSWLGAVCVYVHMPPRVPDCVQTCTRAYVQHFSSHMVHQKTSSPSQASAPHLHAPRSVVHHPELGG